MITFAKNYSIKRVEQYKHAYNTYDYYSSCKRVRSVKKALRPPSPESISKMMMKYDLMEGEPKINIFRRKEFWICFILIIVIICYFLIKFII